MVEEVKQHCYNPKEKKEFSLESKLAEFNRYLDSLQEDSEVFWPRALQLMLFFSPRAQAAFVKALYEFWHLPQRPEDSIEMFSPLNRPLADCVSPGRNHEFRELALLADSEFDSSSLRDIFSSEDMLRELTHYAGRLS